MRIPERVVQHSGHLAPVSSSGAPVVSPFITQAQPPPLLPHILAVGIPGAQPPSRLFALGPTPFSTTPMPKKTLFADSPQSNTQRTTSTTFGHSPGPSPSWEQTPRSQQSWQPTRKPTLSRPQATPDRVTPTSATPTTSYMPQTLPLAPQAPTQTTHNAEGNVRPYSQPGRQPVVTAMISSRKRAAVGAMSPTIRLLAP